MSSSHTCPRAGQCHCQWPGHFELALAEVTVAAGTVTAGAPCVAPTPESAGPPKPGHGGSWWTETLPSAEGKALCSHCHAGPRGPWAQGSGTVSCYDASICLLRTRATRLGPQPAGGAPSGAGSGAHRSWTLRLRVVASCKSKIHQRDGRVQYQSGQGIRATQAGRHAPARAPTASASSESPQATSTSGTGTTSPSPSPSQRLG